jgi:transposase
LACIIFLKVVCRTCQPTAKAHNLQKNANLLSSNETQMKRENFTCRHEKGKPDQRLSYLMETLVQRACGLDVHQASITACIMRQGIERQIKTFGTMTSELLELKQWLKENQITHIAMESTGVYWKPVFNILTEEDWQLLLVNARHIKNVPGHKTDTQDSEWICKLLRAGLLKGSFIPPEDIRQLRDLTRYRKKLQHQVQNEKNRVHKILQEANIKLTSVLTDIFGATGMKILNALAKGVTDPVKLSNYFDEHGRVSHKKGQAKEALTGRFTSHHRFMLHKMLQYLGFLEQQIQDIERQTEQHLQKYQQQVEQLTTIPGIQQKATAAIIAEVGTTLESFPDEKHLASWSGLCPGHNESAGKKKFAIKTRQHLFKNHAY